MRKIFDTAIKTVGLMTLLISTSCEKKLKVRESTPDCIKNKILEMQSNDVTDPPGSVWKYNFHGQTVYYIPPICCDIPSELYDDKCNLICNPDGGFSGAGNGGCTDFFTERTNEVLIWKDSR